jgi:hypothetical protein
MYQCADVQSFKELEETTPGTPVWCEGEEAFHLILA